MVLVVLLVAPRGEAPAADVVVVLLLLAVDAVEIDVVQLRVAAPALVTGGREGVGTKGVAHARVGEGVDACDISLGVRALFAQRAAQPRSNMHVGTRIRSQASHSLQVTHKSRQAGWLAGWVGQAPMAAGSMLGRPRSGKGGYRSVSVRIELDRARIEHNALLRIDHLQERLHSHAACLRIGHARCGGLRIHLRAPSGTTHRHTGTRTDTWWELWR